MYTNTANLMRSVIVIVHDLINTFTFIFLALMSSTMTTKVKLKDVTFTRGSKPMKTLLWCNKVPKGKRNKPAKINGIQHHEISDSVEHTYYQPVN
jgi:hypothetical protein